LSEGGGGGESRKSPLEKYGLSSSQIRGGDGRGRHTVQALTGRAASSCIMLVRTFKYCLRGKGLIETRSSKRTGRNGTHFAAKQFEGGGERCCGANGSLGGVFLRVKVEKSTAGTAVPEALNKARKRANERRLKNGTSFHKNRKGRIVTILATSKGKLIHTDGEYPAQK